MVYADLTDRDLSSLIRAGDAEARGALIARHTRLVRYQAKRMSARGVDRDDLEGEGSLGLIHAAERYDGRAKFSTYAIPWIRQAMTALIRREGSSHRAKPWVLKLNAKRRKVAASLAEAWGREPTDAEVDGVLGLTPEQADLARRAREESVESLGLRDPVAEEPDGLSVEEMIDLEAEISRLGRREQRVFRLARGIGKPRVSFRRIGEALRISHELARRIDEEAFEKVRKGMLERCR
jgi:RNA polymerase primary sigma factor